MSNANETRRDGDADSEPLVWGAFTWTPNPQTPFLLTSIDKPQLLTAAEELERLSHEYRTPSSRFLRQLACRVDVLVLNQATPTMEAR